MFLTTAPLLPTSFESNGSGNREREIALMDEEVRALLQKGAIEKAPKIPGFYSRMFLVP